MLLSNNIPFFVSYSLSLFLIDKSYIGVCVDFGGVVWTVAGKKGGTAAAAVKEMHAAAPPHKDLRETTTGTITI